MNNHRFLVMNNMKCHIILHELKSLKVGKHDVSITSGNSNYYMSAKSSITIKR